MACPVAILAQISTHVQGSSWPCWEHSVCGVVSGSCLRMREGPPTCGRFTPEGVQAGAPQPFPFRTQVAAPGPCKETWRPDHAAVFETPQEGLCRR